MQSDKITLESYVQLHEDITIWYTVDSYQVIYSVQDGGRQVITLKADTIALALDGLLEQLKKKPLQEWRRTTNELTIDLVKGI